MATDTLTTTEAAKELGCSRQTVVRMVERGVVRARRLTPWSPRRVLAEDVERLLEQVEAGGQ